MLHMGDNEQLNQRGIHLLFALLQSTVTQQDATKFSHIDAPPGIKQETHTWMMRVVRDTLNELKAIDDEHGESTDTKNEL